MNAQLEVQEAKDMTAEELAQRIRDFSATAMTTLNERREKGYAAACAPFDKELTALVDEASDIEAKSQGVIERMASAERVKRFEYDQLVVQGQSALARAKLAELEEIKAAPTKIEERRREIAERIDAIEVEKKLALRQAGEDFLKGCTVLIRASETGLALCLDESRARLNSLETRLGTTLYQPAQLTADARSRQWSMLNRLYGGRR